MIFSSMFIDWSSNHVWEDTWVLSERDFFHPPSYHIFVLCSPKICPPTVLDKTSESNSTPIVSQFLECWNLLQKFDFRVLSKLVGLATQKSPVWLDKTPESLHPGVLSNKHWTLSQNIKRYSIYCKFHLDKSLNNRIFVVPRRNKFKSAVFRWNFVILNSSFWYCFVVFFSKKF